MMEKIVAARPQKSFRGLWSKTKSETKATMANTVRTKANRPRILAFSLFGANMMKIKTYMVSITDPVPLIVETKMLFGDTNGRPYL